MVYFLSHFAEKTCTKELSHNLKAKVCQYLGFRFFFNINGPVIHRTLPNQIKLAKKIHIFKNHKF